MIAENEELAGRLYAGIIEREELEDEDAVRRDLRDTVLTEALFLHNVFCPL